MRNLSWTAVSLRWHDKLWFQQITCFGTDFVARHVGKDPVLPPPRPTFAYYLNQLIYINYPHNNVNYLFFLTDNETL
jgi:hypothetical protein